MAEQTDTMAAVSARETSDTTVPAPVPALVPVSAPAPAPAPAPVPLPVKLPRIAIQFCIQCKWMLRAAYYAQELISTFGTDLGEVALQPATGGIFRVTIALADAADAADASAPPRTQAHQLWDRTVDGGFPETKELKRRVRDVIAPGRDLGHVDRAAAKEEAKAAKETKETKEAEKKEAQETVVCQDCQ